MAEIRRISAGLRKESDVDTFIGEDGIIFYDIQNGSLRLSDGKTPGGHMLLAGHDVARNGTLNLISTIKESNDSSTQDRIIDTCSDVRRLSFDLGSGFEIEEQEFNSVKVKHKSSGFQLINVNGNLAVKSSAKNPTVDFVAGEGIRLNTNAGGDPNAIEIQNLAPAARFGAIIEVEVDEHGDLLFTHADAFDEETTYVSNAGYFIITTEEVENELWQR